MSYRLVPATFGHVGQSVGLFDPVAPFVDDVAHLHRTAPAFSNGVADLANHHNEPARPAYDRVGHMPGYDALPEEQKRFEETLHALHMSNANTHGHSADNSYVCATAQECLEPGPNGPIMNRQAVDGRPGLPKYPPGFQVAQRGHRGHVARSNRRSTFRGHARGHSVHCAPYSHHSRATALSAHHNIVDEELIFLGRDVRTTVMIRNIPNTLTLPVLKMILDAWLPGRYDFLYLRIDFTNGMNVGYAFVNFVDPSDIIVLSTHMRYKQWAHSSKIADLSYANLQGLETLVAKFRNSAVMLEHPNYRPHIYAVQPRSVAGYELRFPSSDNDSKQARSIQNARVNGLFNDHVPDQTGFTVAGQSHSGGQFR